MLLELLKLSNHLDNCFLNLLNILFDFISFGIFFHTLIPLKVILLLLISVLIVGSMKLFSCPGITISLDFINKVVIHVGK